jgi:hypothetical protein
MTCLTNGPDNEIELLGFDDNPSNVQLLRESN